MHVGWASLHVGFLTNLGAVSSSSGHCCWWEQHQVCQYRPEKGGKMSRDIILITPQIIGIIYPLPFSQPFAPWMGALCPPASSPGVLDLAPLGRG